MQKLVTDARGSIRDKRKVDFFTRQYVDALAPSNFALTNPEVLARDGAKAGGQNLVNGLNNLLDDLERGNGQLRISMTDYEGVRARRERRDDARQGRVPERPDAADPVRADDGTSVAKRPLLIIPPWINKYYILDLREKNSFIRWAVGAGPHGVRHLVGEPGRAARAQGLRGLHARGPARGARRDRAGDRRARRQRHRLLPGRHAARRARSAYLAAKKREAHQERDLLRRR